MEKVFSLPLLLFLVGELIPLLIDLLHQLLLRHVIVLKYNLVPANKVVLEFLVELQPCLFPERVEELEVEQAVVKDQVIGNWVYFELVLLGI